MKEMEEETYGDGGGWSHHLVGENLNFDNHMMWVDFKSFHIGDTLVLGLRFLGNYKWKPKENSNGTLT